MFYLVLTASPVVMSAEKGCRVHQPSADSSTQACLTHPRQSQARAPMQQLAQAKAMHGKHDQGMQGSVIAPCFTAAG